MLSKADWSGLRNLIAVNAIMSNRITEITATGNPAVFDTNLEKALKDYIIPFSSQTGITGINIFRLGLNLVNDEKRYSAGTGYSLYIGSTGTGYDTFLKAGTYRFCAEMLNGASYDLYYRKSDQEAQYIWKSGDNVTTAVFTLSQDGWYRFNFTSANPTNVGDCWISYGTDEIPYTPYVGTKFPVSWQTGAATEGTFNAITGELTVTAPEAGTYQLEPVLIETLNGANTILTDTNGTNTVKYLKRG